MSRAELYEKTLAIALTTIKDEDVAKSFDMCLSCHARKYEIKNEQGLRICTKAWGGQHQFNMNVYEHKLDLASTIVDKWIDDMLGEQDGTDN